MQIDEIVIAYIAGFLTFPVVAYWFIPKATEWLKAQWREIWGKEPKKRKSKKKKSKKKKGKSNNNNKRKLVKRTVEVYEEEEE